VKRSPVDATALVRKLWQYCSILRDDGLSYPDYVEQLTYLLFLKMSDEQEDGPVPSAYGWSSFADLEPMKMQYKYEESLASLSDSRGMLGLIFSNAKNKIRDPAKLRLLVSDLIGQTEWSGLSDDLKGDAYEGLLEKNARDTKSGAGQYFTPRSLVRAIVECVNPQPGEVIVDPACGTAGFLLAAFRHLREQNPRMTKSQQVHLRSRALRGVELVEEVARLAGMNLLLHGISGGSEGELPIRCADSLREVPEQTVEVVLTNPPFGIRGSVTYSSKPGRTQGIDNLKVVRPDFWAETANKQLNFLQHILSLLSPGGRAAVVLPDNVLFESGAAAAIRRRLMDTCDVHTILRLPSGLFYAQGVKANVVFFDRLKPAQNPLGTLWVYDLRTGGRFSLKNNPLASSDLEEFVSRYQSDHRGKREEDGIDGRWRCFDQRSILESKDCSWDMSWQRDEPSGSTPLHRLSEISKLIEDDLQRALLHVRNISAGME
jgi:type I restriction enzyme M protein